MTTASIPQNAWFTRSSLLALPSPFPEIIRVLFIILVVLLVLNILFNITILGITVPRLI